MADAWQELLHFESRDLLSDLYNSAHGRALNATKAYAIVASLAQGRAYFRSAAGANDLVRPLLLYYGVVAQSRALTLFLSPQLGEEALAPAHGATALDWLGTLGGGEASDRIKRLPNLRISFTRGTFSDLMAATEGLQEADVLGAGGGRFTLRSSADTAFEDTAELTLRDVLARVPDIAYTYARTFDDFSRCLEAKVTYREATKHTIFEVLANRHLGLPSAEMLRMRLLLPPWLAIEAGELRSIFQPGRPVHGFELHHPNELDRLALPMVVQDASGTTYVVTHVPGEVQLSLLGTLFLTSYSVGMLVRYHPSLWFALVGRSKGDFMLPLLQEAVAVIEERFPMLVLRDCGSRPA